MMDPSISDAVAQALTRWALAVHLGLVVTILAVNFALWAGSRREVILTWTTAWAANLVALLALIAEVLGSTDEGWMILFGGAKLVFALLIVRGIMMFKRDRLAMFQLSRTWAVAAGLVFVLLLSGQSSAETQLWTFFSVGIVLAFGALLSGFRLKPSDGWFLVAATVISGTIYLHHCLRVPLSGADSEELLFVSALAFIDVLGEFLIGLACLLALGQRALSEMAQANETLLSTQRAIRTLVDADPLTGLYNRRRLRNFLENTKAVGGSLVFIDVDDFKGINDRWGHLTGDQCLRRIAEALREIFRSEDGLFRVGGDEFLVVVPEMKPGAVRQRIRLLRAKLAPKGSDVVPILIAAGVIELHPDLPMEEALALADTAMYSDKANGSQRR